MSALNIRLAAAGTLPHVLVVPVGSVDDDPAGPVDRAGPDDPDQGGVLLPTALELRPELAALVEAFRADVAHTGSAGTVHVLPRPGQRPHRVVLVGVGTGDEAGWRAAGAAVTRTVTRDTGATLALPAELAPDALAGLVEGLLLAGYRYTLATEPAEGGRLRRLTLATADPARPGYAEAVDRGRVVAESTALARDLVNAPSSEKSPAWLAGTILREAGRYRVRSRVREPDQLRAEGFGGLLAVGGGSPRPPRLVELRWRPRGARRHVVLVGKGITFDTGGISLKPVASMQLMRKDMGGAGAVAATMVGAARLGLPLRLTALLPLADNSVSGDSFRPGDVIRHYGGLTSQADNPDAEGRLVLADALAYAVRRLAPDLLIDLATLTGAQKVALTPRIAALYTEDDALADRLHDTAEAAGEQVWRMPLPDDYVELVRSEIADLNNMPAPGGGDTNAAALYLREFTGDRHDRWVHIDMSAPAWSASSEGVLAKGATGWGVRTLLRFLRDEAAGAADRVD